MENQVYVLFFIEPPSVHWHASLNLPQVWISRDIIYTCPHEITACFFVFFFNGMPCCVVYISVAMAAVTPWGLWRCLGSGSRALSLNAAGPWGWTLKVSFHVGRDKLFCYWTTKNKKNLWPWLKRADERDSERVRSKSYDTGWYVLYIWKQTIFPFWLLLSYFTRKCNPYCLHVVSPRNMTLLLGFNRQLMCNCIRS